MVKFFLVTVLILFSCQANTEESIIYKTAEVRTGMVPVHHTSSSYYEEESRSFRWKSFFKREVIRTLSGKNVGHLGLFLTWKTDPTTTMVVDWHSFDEQIQYISYREENSPYWKELKSVVHVFPFSSPTRWIHRVELVNLKSDSKYLFKVGADSRQYYFRTMPTDLAKRSLRIAIGGDTMHKQEHMEKTAKQVMVYEPDFVVLGGDLAYCDGEPERVGRWYQWIDAYNHTLIAKDGRVIPIVSAIGNHEILGNSYHNHEGFYPDDENRERIAPYFFRLFAFPGQPGYGVLDFGRYLSLILLDTEHANPIAGKQSEWLEQTLKAREDVLHLLPIYHVPAYPSVKDYDGMEASAVRKYFVPLFEKYGVRMAFENHDHAYKRTHPILNGEINQEGIVYMGDGSWGTNPKEVNPADSVWYLNRAESVRAFTILSLENTQTSLIAVDEDGQVIDSYPESPLLAKKRRSSLAFIGGSR